MGDAMEHAELSVRRKLTIAYSVATVSLLLAGLSVPILSVLFSDDYAVRDSQIDKSVLAPPPPKNPRFGSRVTGRFEL
jgi:hypothetical protein